MKDNNHFVPFTELSGALEEAHYLAELHRERKYVLAIGDSYIVTNDTSQICEVISPNNQVK